MAVLSCCQRKVSSASSCRRLARSSRSAARRASEDSSSSLASAISSISIRRTARSTSSTSTGRLSISMRSRLAASSTRSIALSGRKRAVTYRSDRVAAATIARVGDPDTVVHLVALLEPAQDADRVLDARLADEDLLEAALERRVLLDVLAELVERGRADHAQLAAGEHRLDHVAGVHRGVAGGARADDGVQLVDEGDDLPLGVGDLLEHGLEPLLELTAVLGAGDHGAEVQRHQALALQALRDVAGHHALGEALDDRRLADAGLADQDRVVLGAPGQHLDDAADLGVAADDRVDLAVAGALGEVDGVLLQRLERALRVGGGDLAVAADGAEGGQQGVAGGAGAGEHVAGLAVGAGEADQQVLGRDVLVAEGAGLLPRGVDHAQQLAGRRGRGHGRAADAGHAAQRRLGLGADVGRVGADRGQERTRDAVGLLQQGGEQVQRFERRLAAADGEPLGGGEGFLRTGRELALHGRRRASSRLGCGAPGSLPGGVVDRSNDHRVESVPLNLAASTRRPGRPLS